MESADTKKQNSSGRQPSALLVCFGVFLVVLACLSLAFSVYSFKKVYSMEEGKFVDSGNDLTDPKIKLTEHTDPRVRRHAPQRGEDPCITCERCKKSETGPTGPQGSSTSDSIHLIGDGPAKVKLPKPTGVLQDYYRIESWILKHNISIIYDTGDIVVKKSGYYFIYSQLMYYFDGDTTEIGHYTCINGERIMNSAGSVNKTESKHGHQVTVTKYQGGVFHVKAGDAISVHFPYDKFVKVDRLASYFGAFLLH